MPIFYEHIKGCHKDSTSTNNGNWSWIEWQKNANPKIYLETSSTKSSNGDQGNIITSAADNQSITKPFLFADNVSIKAGKNLYFSSNSYIADGDNDVLTISSDIIKFCAYSYIDADACFFANQGIQSKTGLYVGVEQYNLEQGVIKAQNKCEALYFNATSDRRAKTNINPLKSSALSVVKSLPIYTFNYVDKPEELVVGLIAQEAAEHPLDDFNMVDNINASGQGYDLMQMKESKLVYVLWKAVQELSAEVESLKEQLNSK